MFTVFSIDGERRDEPRPEGGGDASVWRVEAVRAVRGDGLPSGASLRVTNAAEMPMRGTPWPLVGVASNGRYTQAAEKAVLDARQAGLGRAEATCGVLIPIRKNAAWWALTQDTRRAIFEEQSHHIAGTLHALPAVARKLYHSRDLGEPFDFLTWFEFAPEHRPVFDETLAFLRASREWLFVEREVEVWLRRA